VAITAGPHKVARLKVTLLSNEVGLAARIGQC
jgi:hypothetical protein